MHKIAVILPVYNGCRYLEQSIVSVLNQTLSPFEFLICDDGSTDKSIDTIKNIQQKYPGRIKLLVNMKNLGLFATLNILLEAATANLVHIWSQDDIMHPECLSECLKFHSNNPNVGMSYHSVEYIDENNNIIRNESIDNTPQIIPVQLYLNICIRFGCITDNISTVTIDKTKIKNIGFFNKDLKVSGDFEFWTRIAQNSDIGRIDKKLIYLRRHQQQLSRSYSSIYPRIAEDMEIHAKIISLLMGKEKSQGIKFNKYKTQPSYFNDLLFLISKKEYIEAKKAFMLLNANTNILSLFLRWSIFTISRKFKVDKKLIRILTT
ncbi:glycosyltransferase [Pedobacter lithocola]|uniref:Glycosyltransferase n=1 Tax=Pedobacter lithocola TaxID=1908239 RepID=A0ABV8PAW0_9SPHI